MNQSDHKPEKNSAHMLSTSLYPISLQHKEGAWNKHYWLRSRSWLWEHKEKRNILYVSLSKNGVLCFNVKIMVFKLQLRDLCLTPVNTSLCDKDTHQSSNQWNRQVWHTEGICGFAQGSFAIWRDNKIWSKDLLHMVNIIWCSRCNSPLSRPSQWMTTLQWGKKIITQNVVISARSSGTY